MDRAILARHGESVRSISGLVNGDPAVDAPLTSEGRRQALALGQLLVDDDVDLVITSAFPRTVETARIAMQGRGVPHVVVADLDDLVFGVFENGTLGAYREWVGSHEPEQAPPGGESRSQSVRRWVRGFQTILERPERLPLVVCHGMAIAYLLAALRGMPPGPRATEVDYARPHRMTREDVMRALELLTVWCTAPAWPVTT